MARGTHPNWSPAKTAYYSWGAVWAWTTQVRPCGKEIYSEEWDLLIVLDACRVDLLESVADDYEFITSVDTVRSRGSLTTEWLSRNFTTEHLDDVRRTTYVTSTPHSQTVFREKSMLTSELPVPIPYPTPDAVDLEDFAHLEEVWRYDHDGDHPVVPPREVTDATIQHARDGYDRLVTHYMQPHEPFIADKAPVTGDEFDELNVWDAMSAGSVSREAVWRSYVANLRYVLDEVELLLNNVDADSVVITADHGNAMGEWGNVCGHPFGWPAPEVRVVPWVETTATDEMTYVPEEKHREESENVREQLESLGYR